MSLSDSSTVPWQVSTAAFVATICSSMASTMGIIMAVVAVLLIHMDRKAVTDIKPSISLQRRGREESQSPSCPTHRILGHNEELEPPFLPTPDQVSQHAVAV